jgi:hypothetical protein
MRGVRGCRDLKHAVTLLLPTISRKFDFINAWLPTNIGEKCLTVTVNLAHRRHTSFAWLLFNRRLSREYERLCATAETWIYLAMIRLMVRRLVQRR